MPTPFTHLPLTHLPRSPSLWARGKGLAEGGPAWKDPCAFVRAQVEVKGRQQRGYIAERDAGGAQKRLCGHLPQPGQETFLTATPSWRFRTTVVCTASGQANRGSLRAFAYLPRAPSWPRLPIHVDTRAGGGSLACCCAHACASRCSSPRSGWDGPPVAFLGPSLTCSTERLPFSLCYQQRLTAVPRMPRREGGPPAAQDV